MKRTFLKKKNIPEKEIINWLGTVYFEGVRSMLGFVPHHG
jgi:hypothetical protein